MCVCTVHAPKFFNFYILHFLYCSHLLLLICSCTHTHLYLRWELKQRTKKNFSGCFWEWPVKTRQYKKKTSIVILRAAITEHVFHLLLRNARNMQAWLGILSWRGNWDTGPKSKQQLKSGSWQDYFVSITIHKLGFFGFAFFFFQRI